MTAPDPAEKRYRAKIDAEASSLLLLAKLRRISRATYESGAGVLAAQFIENARSRADVIRRRGKKRARYSVLVRH